MMCWKSSQQPRKQSGKWRCTRQCRRRLALPNSRLSPAFIQHSFNLHRRMYDTRLHQPSAAEIHSRIGKQRGKGRREHSHALSQVAQLARRFVSNAPFSGHSLTQHPHYPAQLTQKWHINTPLLPLPPLRFSPSSLRTSGGRQYDRQHNNSHLKPSL